MHRHPAAHHTLLTNWVNRWIHPTRSVDELFFFRVHLKDRAVYITTSSLLLRQLSCEVRL